MSEVSPVASVNVDRRGDIASVGRPLKSFEAKVDAETGELLLRGPAVMRGYHNQPEMTAEVIDSEGWLHTGDIAEIRNGGHIYITGRIKNMIVLSGGKKVFPEEVEAVLEKALFCGSLCTGYIKNFWSKRRYRRNCGSNCSSKEVMENITMKTLIKLSERKLNSYPPI